MIAYKPRFVLAFFTLFAASATACDNRLLVGNDPDGGAPMPPSTPPGHAGTTGTAGTTGAGGTSPNTDELPPGAAGTAGPATGIGGSGPLPNAGSAGSGAAGSAPLPNGGLAGSGAGSGAPSTTRTETPLWITGDQALTRIAAVLWNDAPDADLLSQARLGHFTTTGDLYGAVRQMLADPRARAGVGAFYRWWLDLPRLADLAKDANLFPTFTPALRADMATETETFGVNVTLMAGGNFGTLVSAPMSYLNERLATQIYGRTDVAGDAFRMVALPATQRAGLLTQPALQALTSFANRNSPTARGSYLSGRFFCQPLPAPPPSTGQDPLAAGTTVRRALEEATNVQGACQPCHKLTDPPGLAFETFDAIGRFRTTDNGFPVDVSNLVISNAFETPTTVNGPVQLATVVAQSPHAQECMTRQWMAYVLGARPQELDPAAVQRANAVFVGAGLDLKELIAAVLTSDAFLAPR